MRLTLRLASLSLLTVPLSQSVDVVVQSEDARFFQMAILTYPYLDTGVTWEDTAPYVDIGVFTSDNPAFQPPGPSIMLHEQWLTTSFASLAVDWSRILAVVIDEPYVTELGINTANPACETGSRNETMTSIRGRIRDAAADVHRIAPRTRVWLNFHWQEVEWMRASTCPAALNDPSIDVVSLDKYEADFSDIEDDYAWFVSAWPEQQLALIPATSYSASGDARERARAAAKTARRLQGFFAYANRMNGSQHHSCDMDLGRVGRTGHDDGCRVWMVAGWSSIWHFDQGPGWYGMLRPGDDNAKRILDEWVAEFSKPRRSGAAVR